MNLILDVNDNLFSLQRSSDADQKVQSAIKAAIDDIKQQAAVNNDRKKKGLSPVPYRAVVKDEYGKDIVTIRQAENLLDIRNAYRKKVDSLSYENKEKTLLTAMNEVGNSDRSEQEFKKDLFDRLNSCLFVSDAQLSPGLEKILDYFGDTNSLFNTINFKTDISTKCIQELIDMPDPHTGKPPKSFQDFLRNIVTIDRIFRNNPSHDDYLEKARIYIKMHYLKIIPDDSRTYFENRGGLTSLIQEWYKIENQNRKLETAEFEVTENNFKQYFISFSKLGNFSKNPFELRKYLMEHVKPENRERVDAWLEVQGCHDDISTAAVFARWTEQKPDMKKSVHQNQNRFSGREDM